MSTHVNTFHKNVKWQFLVFYYHDDITQHINTCTQPMLICRYNHVCFHGVFAYENINAMTFKCVIACAWTLGGVTSFVRLTLFKLYLRLTWCDLLSAYVPCLHCFGAYCGHINSPLHCHDCICEHAVFDCFDLVYKSVCVICFAVSRLWLRVRDLPWVLFCHHDSVCVVVVYLPICLPWPRRQSSAGIVT